MSSSDDEIMEEIRDTCEQNAHSSSSNKVRNIYTPQLLSALDRTKCSDRNAIYTIDAVLKASGSKSENYNLNRSSLRQYRQDHRFQIASKLKERFNPVDPLPYIGMGK